MTRDARLEVALHVGPLTSENAEHDAVAHGAVASCLMVSKDAVLLRAEGRDRSLRGEVEVVGAKADNSAAQRIEGMAEQETLARGVDMAALPTAGVPRVTDLDTIDRGNDVVVSSASDDLAC